MQLVFETEFEAAAVANQLYKVHQVGRVLNLNNVDTAALSTAIALAKVTNYRYEYPIVSRERCLLPFPVSERQSCLEDCPEIYVTCLSAYSNGLRHGMWIDAARRY
jgi:antirestriction protein